MRIGLLIYGDLAQVSGGYLYDRKLVEHLRRQGDEVDVLSLPYRTYAQHLGDNFSCGLAERMLRGNWDALLQDELNHPSLFLLNRHLKGKVGYPILSVVHHLRCDEGVSLWQGYLYRNIERRYLQTLDGCIFNSRTVKGRACMLLGHEPVSVLAYPGKDGLGTGFVRGREGAEGCLRVLFLGNVIERKGLHTLIEALSRTRTARWTLEVVGDLSRDREYAGRMLSLVARERLGGRVRFHGQLPAEKVVRILGRSDLLAVPSRYEGFGIVYLEALGCGVPVVASSCGGASELVRDGREGFLIAPGDAQTLRRRIELLDRDRTLLARMSANALRRYREFPDWETSSAAVRGFLCEIIKNCRLHRPAC